MRYFVVLSYKGTAYHGWQRQPNAISVQGTLEAVLSTRLRSNVELVGAGRTDAGVHASYYTAHFDYTGHMTDTVDLTHHLNRMLPRDIAVMGVHAVKDGAHARFDAIEREYTYIITTVKRPFGDDMSWLYSAHLDIAAMNDAAASLLEEDDFTTFAKLNSNNKTNICHVAYAQWQEADRGLVFTIRADRFLRNMVRSITGTLVDVGRGKMSPAGFRSILHARDLSLACSSAPAQGLFLSNIKYDPDVFPLDKTTCPPICLLP